MISINGIIGGNKYYGFNVNTIFVKKGMTIKFTGSSYAIGVFTPFI